MNTRSVLRTRKISVHHDDGNDTLQNIQILRFKDADVLVGGPGPDVLDLRIALGIFGFGSTNNDIYIVDDAQDRAVELPGEGIDTVQASIDFILV